MNLFKGLKGIVEVEGYYSDTFVINCWIKISLVKTTLLQRKSSTSEREAKKIELKINDDKTIEKDLTLNRIRHHIRENVTKKDYNLENVQALKYLGAMLTSENNTEKEIKQRIVKANTCLLALQFSHY